LIEIMAKALGVPKRAIALVSGERSRQKRLRVSGMPAEDIAEKLRLACDAQ
jgi:uncharacterized protein YggU (UPF0235/DUF167 family)